MKRIKQITKDGSYTLIDTEKKTGFHSIHGAVQESNHVFINSGFEYCLQQFSDVQEIYILEAGFGTGLNALLTVLKAKGLNKRFIYHTIEAFPLIKEEWELPEFDKILKDSIAKTVYEMLHLSEWNKEKEIFPGFFFTKYHMSIEEFIPNEKYHLIYYDAFAPSAQPELWTEKIFGKLAIAMVQHASLVTFCSKTSVRNAMKESGLVVTKLPGPPGKREIVRALKP